MNKALIPFFARFIEQRIEPDLNGGCWLWSGYIHTTNGYGVIGVRKSGKLRQYGAHRASWMVRNGEIPPGMNVCHRCDVRTCVNPDHLFLGTQGDNMRDMFAKGRHERHGQKLTDDQVLAIRSDGRTCDVIAAEYGVGRSTIDRVRRRVIYSKVPDNERSAAGYSPRSGGPLKRLMFSLTDQDRAALEQIRAGFGVVSHSEALREMIRQWPGGQAAA